MSSKKRSPRLDCHVDTLLRVLLQSETGRFDFGDNPETRLRILSTQPDVTLDKLRLGGMTGCFFAAFTANQGSTEASNDVLARMFGLLYKNLARIDRFRGIAVTPTETEIRKAADDGLAVAVPCIEGGYGIDGQNYEAMIEQYRDLGVRYVTLVWNNNNHLGSGTNADILPTDVTDDIPEPPIGLTELGARVVGILEQHGILVDVSHMDDLTLEGTLKAARRPLIATHSNSDFVNKDRRNLNDEQIRAIAATGGVVSLSTCNRFVNTDKPKADLPKLLLHFEHIHDLVGAKHMGFGSDFDGATMIPEIPDIASVGVLRSALAERFPEEDIDRIFGESVLRLLREADAAPKSLASRRSDIRLSFDFHIADLPSGDAELTLSLTPELSAHLWRSERGAAICGAIVEPRIVAFVDGYRFDASYREQDSVRQIVARIPKYFADRFRSRALFVTFDRQGRRITGVTEFGELCEMTM